MSNIVAKFGLLGSSIALRGTSPGEFQKSPEALILEDYTAHMAHSRPYGEITWFGSAKHTTPTVQS